MSGVCPFVELRLASRCQRFRLPVSLSATVAGGKRSGRSGQCSLYQLGKAGASIVVVAWGNHGALMNAERQWNIPALTWCLGRTKQGAPRHPLYVRSDTMLEPFGGEPAV